MRHKLKEHKILSAATLPELDDAYTKRVHNFKTISELYTWSSSINYLPNINIPMIFINALDDPIVPEQLLDPIKKFAGGKRRYIPSNTIKLCYIILFYIVINQESLNKSIIMKFYCI